MKKIVLSRGLFALVDDEDYEWLNQWKWYAHGNGKWIYALRQKRFKNGTRRPVRMHREILKVSKEDWVDHKDGNGLNNCRDNIRIATISQNCINRRMQCNNTSGFRGVMWKKDVRYKIKKWQARLKVNGKYVELGYFKKPEEAALAYNEAAKKYHGEFARLNQV